MLPSTTRRMNRQFYLSLPSKITPAVLSATSTEAAQGGTTDQVERIKEELVKACLRPSTNRDGEVIRNLVQELKQTADRVGTGQISSSSGLLSGEWELLYASDDETRSSPFFWAFRKAFPEQADQIFMITDSIPAPVKEVGPSFQVIDWDDAQQIGRFVSRVRVATLAGTATSIMTTKAAIVGSDGVDGIRLKIESTKPEKSTILSLILGPIGEIINENAPAFPSGEVLERVRPGSSEVVLRTPFCDEGLRVSYNDERPDDFFVWRRREFSEYDLL